MTPEAVLFAFLASLGLDWPQLPLNVRLAELLALPAAAMVLAARGPGLRMRLLDALVIAYVAAGALSLLTSPDPAAGGVELARHVYVALIYFLVAIATRRGLIGTVAVGLAAMGIVLAVPSLLVLVAFIVADVSVPAVGEVMKLPYIGEVLRLRALTASPTLFACVLTVALPFSLVHAVRGDGAHRRLWWLAVTAMSLAGVLTFSHVWAAVALAVTVWSWPLLARHHALRIAMAAGVVLLTVAFNVTLIASVRAIGDGDAAVTDQTVYPYGVEQRRTAVGPYTVDYSVMSYFRIKELAAEAFLARPLTGVGLDRFHVITEAAYADGRLPHGYRRIDPHSSLLGRLAETGIVGGLTLLALWAAVIVIGAVLARSGGPEQWLARAALAGFLGLLLAGINVDVMNFRFLWASIGVLRGLAELRA
jgi:hypothetical protein